MKDDLLPGAASAANFLGLTRRQVYRLAEDGYLPVIRKGRSLFFRKSELQAAFQSRSRVDKLPCS